jgi:hypothetical protein
MFSSGGPLSFFETLLGDLAPVVRGGISWNNELISQAMFRGIRFAQDLCYCRDWGKYKPVKLMADPFGRAPKKMAAKIASEGDTPVTGAYFEPYDMVAISVQSSPQGPAAHNTGHNTGTMEPYINQMQFINQLSQQAPAMWEPAPEPDYDF